MAATTVTLSSKGQLSLPKELRDKDDLEASDVFRLQRLAPGKYLLEKLTLPALPKARLLRSKDGFMVFRPPRGAPPITMELVKKLEAETV
jgi:bifunctional DNA-binding transcriptional regulator/antitoxin component of YhaV-PrlF toxin-antitoxin module